MRVQISREPDLIRLTRSLFYISFMGAWSTAQIHYEPNLLSRAAGYDTGSRQVTNPEPSDT